MSSLRFRVIVILILLQTPGIAMQNHSLIPAGEIIEVIQELHSEKTSLRIQFLFDDQYEDTVNNASRLSYDMSAGMMMYRNDGKEETLRQMLTLASSGTTVLMALCSPQNIYDIFLMIRTERLPSHQIIWLLFLRDLSASSWITLSLEGLVHEGTRVALLTKDPGGEFFHLASSRIDDEGAVRFTDVGKWYRNSTVRNEKRLFDMLYPDEGQSYRDMEGRRLNIASNDIEGFFGIDWSSKDVGDAPKVLGMDGAIIKALSKALNFTYTIVRPNDGLWGNPLGDGTVTGLIGLAARREVAFAISAISVTWLRETAVDFTYPYLIEPLALFSRAPKEKNRLLAVLSPFDTQVWLAVIAATLAMGPILSLHSKVSDRALHSESKLGLQAVSFNVFRSLVVQGNKLRVNDWSMKFMFFSWYLFCLIVSALYSGMLTAVLAIPAYEEPIDSLTDLPRASRNGFSIGILKDTANELLFREATSGIFREVWLLFDHDDPPESFVPRPEMGIQRAMEKKYVFIGFKISSELLVSRLGRRKFHVGKQDIFPLGIAMACPPGVPYKPILDIMLMRIIEGGLLSKWRADEFTKVSYSASSQDEGTSKTYAISLSHLQAAFVIATLGFLVAAVVLAVENVLPDL